MRKTICLLLTLFFTFCSLKLIFSDYQWWAMPFFILTAITVYEATTDYEGE